MSDTKQTTPGKILRPDILLCHNSVKALYSVCPRTILGDRAWNQIREWCYKRENYTCQVCGIHREQLPFKKQVEAHEFYSIDYEEGVVTLKEIVVLCPECHSYIHSRRMATMVEKGIVSPWYADYVKNKAEKILTEAGLPLRPEIPESKVPWNDWYFLDEHGNRHFSKFVSERHCDLHYEKENQKMINRKNRS